MNQRRHAVLDRQHAGVLQCLGVVGVDGVRSHCRRNQRVVLELLDEGLRANERFARRLGVGNRKLDDGFAKHTAQTGGARFLRNLLLEVIHVRESGRAGLDHLERGEPRAGTHEFGRDGLRLRGKDVLREPVFEREVVRQPTEQDHGRMRVGVDESGHHHLTGRIDRLPPAELPPNLVRHSDGNDVSAIDCDAAGTYDSARAIDGDDDPVGDHERDLPRRLRRYEGDRGERNCQRREQSLHGRHSTLG